MLNSPAAALLVRIATSLLVLSVLVRLLPMSTASTVVDDLAIAVSLALVVATSIYARLGSTAASRDDRALPPGSSNNRPNSRKVGNARSK